MFFPFPLLSLRSSPFSGYLAWVGVLLGFRPICFFELAKPLPFPSFFRFSSTMSRTETTTNPPPKVNYKACSGRLTWDVFMRNLARQLGTPSLWLPVDTCKEGQKGALVAVCTPTLKSASKKHQKLYTSISEHREWHSEGGQKKLCIMYLFSLWKTTSL